MAKKKERHILEKDTEFYIKFKQRHPRGSMRIGGVSVSEPGNYTLLAGTDITSEEVLHWFDITPSKKQEAPKSKEK